MSEPLPHITWDSGPAPCYSMLWLHGLGASGDDFVPVAQALRLPHAVRHLFPQAPERPVTINGGQMMPAWYDLYDIGPNTWNLAGIEARQDEAGIRASQREIDRLIEREIARGIAPSQIFLAGFSQGGAIALQCGLRREEGLGGILALSTYLPLADTVATEASAKGLATPLFMAHGRQDPVVPYALGAHAHRQLQAAGCAADWHAYDMPHSVCMEEIDDIAHWLTARMTP